MPLPSITWPVSPPTCPTCLSTPLSFAFREHSCGGGEGNIGQAQETVDIKKGVANEERANMESGAPAGTGTDEGGDALQPDLGFGDDVIHDHVDHGAGSKGQSVRQDGLGQNHGEGPKEPSHGLHHATQLPVPTDRTETVPPRGSGRQSTCSRCGRDSNKRMHLFHMAPERGGSAALLCLTTAFCSPGSLLHLQ